MLTVFIKQSPLRKNEEDEADPTQRFLRRNLPTRRLDAELVQLLAEQTKNILHFVTETPLYKSVPVIPSER